MVECPTCGKVLETEVGKNRHHKQVHDVSLVKVDIACEWCGAVDSVRQSDIKNQENYYCSRECWGEWLSEDRTGESKKFPKELQSEDALRKLYEVEQLSTNEIAAKAGVSRTTTIDWMDRYGIERRSVEAGESHLHYRRVQVECSSCGSMVERVPSRVEKNEHHFCNLECRTEWRSEHWTGTDHPNYERIEVNCHCCNTTLSKRPSRVARTKRQFCSQECESKWRDEDFREEGHPLWKGGSTRYGKGWNEQKRRRVRIRDQARCQHCGRVEPDHRELFGCNLHVHHITPAREIDDPEERNAMHNLITLCAGECHSTWERMSPLRPDTRQPAD